jgi:hypothetical protein
MFKSYLSTGLKKHDPTDINIYARRLDENGPQVRDIHIEYSKQFK